MAVVAALEIRQSKIRTKAGHGRREGERFAIVANGFRVMLLTSFKLADVGEGFRIGGMRGRVVAPDGGSLGCAALLLETDRLLTRVLLRPRGRREEG